MRLLTQATRPLSARQNGDLKKDVGETNQSGLIEDRNDLHDSPTEVTGCKNGDMASSEHFANCLLFSCSTS